MGAITPAPPKPNFAESELELGRLAYAWRSNPHDALVAQYQNTLRRMIRSGFDQPLDIDAELPDRLMPEEYLKLHR
jgi:hypothetical protein